MAYKDIFQHQCQHSILTAILTEDNKILYYGYVTTDSGNNSSNINCSLKTYECTIDK